MAYPPPPNTPGYPENPWANPQQNPYIANGPWAAPTPPKSNGLAIAGVTLSSVGFGLLLIPVVGTLLSLTGVVLSWFGLRKARKQTMGRGRAPALVGVLIGTLGFLGGGTWSAGSIAYASYMGNTMMELGQGYQAVENYRAQNGGLPLRLDDLGNPDLTRDLFDRGYVYTRHDDGTYSIASRGIKWIPWDEIAKPTRMVYDSATGGLAIEGGQQVMDQREFERFLQDLAGGRFRVQKPLAQPEHHDPEPEQGTAPKA